MGETLTGDDSQPGVGGHIPGASGHPAFSLAKRASSPVPVIVAVPHAGRLYPQEVLEALRDPRSAALKLEDRHADRLADIVCGETGAAKLICHAPRAMIDLNRQPDDIDPEMFLRSDRAGLPPASSRGRARNGLGLIPRRVPGLGELWTRPMDSAGLHDRLAGIHRPYHRALSATLREIRARWGAALLIDLHSMPSIERTGGSGPRFVIGDRFGASCHGSLVASSFTFLGDRQELVAHNRPYAGGYVLDRHGEPHAGIHAIQVEVDRAAYLDAGLDEPGEGLDATAETLVGLVRRLAEETCKLAGYGVSAARMAAE